MRRGCLWRQGEKMKIIIVGCGKVGESIVEALCSENHDVSVIDMNRDVIDRVSYAYDILGICGSGVISSTLKEAGAATADLLIASTATDEHNLLSCVVAKQLGTKRCIARVRDPQHNTQSVFLSQGLGISMTVNPELLASREISRLLRMPSALEVNTFARGRIDMVQVKLTKESPICDTPLYSLSSVLRSKILVCAIQRPGVEEAIIPTGNFVPKEGDKVYITAPHKEMSLFFRETGLITQKIKNVIIIGGGRMTFYLATLLCDAGMNVKIIEKNKEKCHFLAEQLPKVTIIHADGNDQQILEEEGLDEVDSLVTLTGMDEDNTIISMYAKLKGVPKVITKINKSELKAMAESVGLDSVISPKDLTAEIMLAYVRSLKDAKGSKVRTIYRVADGKAEALEFLAEEGCKVLNTPFMNLKLKKNLLIGGIIRQGKIIFPGGSESIHAGDLVIVVTTNKFISSLDEILE